MVGYSIANEHFDCKPGGHGFIRDFRYGVGRVSYYAFIPNREWLLFYFRLPKRSHFKIIENRISQSIQKDLFHRRKDGERTFKVYSLKDAKVVTDIAFDPAVLAAIQAHN